ncbi:hypothetical protein AMAG_11874 [Allomyces macrogynus ATCC 38327]|uniref:Cns1/TTC4 wheel domain-containing protein n=1 Tax=Allomyces macrogynus (strain ATCC 38327) TaxID=578462 RepID=A0A0L0SYI4_ALLM3|nr:hypothetical protein AMAG_11874 [Allomyces macrogynus ATCC 38327]|eukprot:KNE67409.1 hypothetical protein AMAG_11874 [Allomyces macrogynus ATCC 38327]
MTSMSTDPTSATAALEAAAATTAQTGDVEFDMIEAIAKMRSQIGPDGKPIKPSWALSEDNWEEEMKSIPLFMRSFDPNADVDTVPELAALQSLIYDGTPEEIADNFKNQGNDMFRDGKHHYPHAIQYYTQGIDQKCKDAKLNSVLYANRAAVNLELGNLRKCVNDCLRAIEHNPTNIKAYYRAGRAYHQLEKYDEAVSAFTHGLAADPNNGSIKVALEAAQKAKLARDAKDAEKRAQQEYEAQQEALVAAVMKKRGIRSGTVLAQLPNAEYASHRPSYDPTTDTLTVPCLILYPEFNQSDFITHFPVESTFAEQLAPVLDEAAAPWDPQHTYRSATTDVYFLTFNEDPNLRRLVKVGKKNTLQSVLKLSWSCVVNGVVEFLVLHRNNQFCKEYVEKYRQRASPASSASSK